MTTSNAVTMSHVRSFFSLEEELVPLDIAPTATGGLGINNLAQYPPPRPPVRKKMGIEYCKKFIEEDKQDQILSRQTLDLPGGSTVNVNDLNDVEDLSTAVGDVQIPDNLQSELTQQIYATYYKTDVKYNPDLTITNYREQILQLLNINPVVVIQGSTGCGKTTQVPQFILDHHASRGTYCNVIVTQPRKIAATSIARRVCHERNWQLGTLVGYQVAMDNKTSADTRLSYVTTGVLLQKLVNSRRMDMYTHVILDEVHERDQNTDFALLVVKKLLRTNSKRVKVILMSATIDTSLFARYFPFSTGEPAPIIEITGKPKEVTEHYLQELSALGIQIPEPNPAMPTIPDALYDIVVKLMFIFDKIEKSEQEVSPEEDYAPARGAVLIFLPGYEEISVMTNKLRSVAFNRKFWILPLHSTITLEEQIKVFQIPPSDHRKVIISTNIAESSITVPDIKYVIDFCLTKNLVCDPDTNYTCLQLEWASKANCMQRKGRAGRVDIGRVYRMVSREFYEDHLPEYGVPEMQRCPLAQTILATKKLNFGEPQALLALALQPPNLSDIESAILDLKEALALTTDDKNSAYDGNLTFIGHVMTGLPLDVKISKLIIFGYVFGCLDDCLIIAASISLKSFFARPFQRILDAYKSRLAWAHGTFSDCLAYLNAFKEWKKASVQGLFRKPGGGTEEQWGKTHFIQIRRIKEVDLLIKELTKRLSEFNIASEGNSYTTEAFGVFLLKIIIAGAFFPNYFFQEEINEQEVIRETNGNDPFSTVIISGLPSNQGLLYACNIRDALACCGSRMNIDFEERHAYIQFDRLQYTEEYKVLPAVYLACKMRQLRMPLELVLFSQHDAKRKMEQLLALKQSSNAEQRLRSNRFSVQFNKSTVNHVPLPDITVSTIQIFISHIINCGHFWARYVDADSTNLLKFLDTTVNLHRGKNLHPLTRNPVTDMLVLAPFSEYKDGPAMYFRAQIREIGEHKDVTVFFIDYGNTSCMKISELREIDEATMPDVLTTPAMAFQCFLSEVKPLSSSGQWSPQSIRWFNSAVNGIVLRCKVYSVLQDTVRLELFKLNKDNIFESINNLLIALKYAELAEESLVSKQNNELRVKSNNYVTNVISPDQECGSLFTAEELGGLKITNQKIRLHGPNNPLEVNYKGVTYLDSVKRVKVERDSVNSVSFNAEPQDTHTSMLVAGYMSMGQNSDILNARSTTLMPKIQGLPSLICLLFSPRVEIRTDKKRSMYTGALCGLGFDAFTGESLYQAHNIELEFDVMIDKTQIEQINFVRSTFNHIICCDSGLARFNAQGIKGLQEKLGKAIKTIFEQTRKPQTPVSFGKRYQWQQIQPEHLLRAEGANEPATEPVLPAIDVPSLAKDSNIRSVEKLRNHCKELYNISGQSIAFKSIRCKICDQEMSSERDLLLHLDSEVHIRNEERIFNE